MYKRTVIVFVFLSMFINCCLAQSSKESEIRCCLSLRNNWRSLETVAGNFSLGVKPDTSTTLDSLNWQGLEFKEKEWKTVSLPRSFSKITYFRKSFRIPESMHGKKIFLNIRAGYACWVWINGHLIKGKPNNELFPDALKTTSMEALSVVEVTDIVDFSSENIIAVKIFPCGTGSFSLLELHAFPEIFIKRCLISPDTDKSMTKVKLCIVNTASNPLNARIDYSTGMLGRSSAGMEMPALNFIIPAKTEKEFSFSIKYENIQLWDMSHPVLYDLKLTMRSADGKLIDQVSERFGFRKFSIVGRRFLLNNKTIFLKGWNELGGRWENKNDGQIVEKLNNIKDLNINAVRNFGGMTPKKVYDIADKEGGILFMHGLPWAPWYWNKYISMEKQQEDYMEILTEDLYKYYNNPSIVMYALSNEAWSTPIDILNQKYYAAKALDTSRPILTVAGGTDYRLGGMLYPEYQNYKTDIDDFHCYHSWYEKPLLYTEDWFDFVFKKYNGPARPLLSTELVGRYPDCVIFENLLASGPWPRWLGEKILTMKSPKDRFLLAAGKCAYATKVAGEMVRVRKGNTSALWLNIDPRIYEGITVHADALRNVFSPIYVCARIYDKNYFTDTVLNFPLFVINDKQEVLKDVFTILRIVDSNNKSLIEKKYDFGSIAADGIAEKTASVELNKNWGDGDYKLVLELLSEEKSLFRNEYPLLLKNADEFRHEIKTAKRVLLLDKNGQTEKVLDALKIPYTLKTSLDSVPVSDFDVLIVGAFFTDGLDLRDMHINEWIKGGGRLLCLEQSPQRASLAVKAIFPFFNDIFYLYTDDYLQGQQNSFIDVRVPEHPVFNGLAADLFDNWNGQYHILSDGLFVPYEGIKKYTLAQGKTEGHFNYSSTPGAVLINLKYGNGEILVSQILSVCRWQKDPIATKFLRNVFEYILTMENAAVEFTPYQTIGAGPFLPDKDGFIRNWLVCGPFPCPGGRRVSKSEYFDKDFFFKDEGAVWVEKNESTIEPIAGMKHVAHFPDVKNNDWGLSLPFDIECRWEGIASPLYMNRLLGKFMLTTDIIAYACCYIESPEEKTVNLKIGSDDGYKLWVNGNQIAKMYVFRGAKIDQEEYAVKLKKGMNKVLIKITQNNGDFCFCTRFVDVNDKPLTDLKIWLVPKSD